MIFLCGRPACGGESTATLQIDAIAETVSLVDPRISRDGVPLCQRHADMTTPPVGWAMNDLRSTSQALASSDLPASGEPPIVESTPPRVRPGSEILDRPGQRMSRRQSITDRARQHDSDVDPVDEVATASDGADVIDLTSSRRDKRPTGQDAAPASRPARRREAGAEEKSQQEMFPWHYEFDEEDEPEELQASSPLLSRAFRATTGH